ncbi:MAG: endonuclease/exonuclease/phosphatase family protein [Pseudomonadota bacterium]
MVNFISFNARSIRNKVPDLLFELSSNPSSICCVTESWLQGNSDDSILSDVAKTHYIIRVDDDSRAGRGGGVLMLLPLNLQFEIIEEIANDYFELSGINLYSQKTHIFSLFLAYRSPSPDMLQSTLVLTDTLSRILHVSPTVTKFILGDFNYPRINWANPDLSELHPCDASFVHAMYQLGFSQLISEPTHNGGNCLDLLFTNYSNVVGNIEVGASFSTSDHFIISGFFGPFYIKPDSNSQGMKFRNFHRSNFI